MNKYLVTVQFKVLSDTSEGAERALKEVLKEYPASWWILSSQSEGPVDNLVSDDE